MDIQYSAALQSVTTTRNSVGLCSSSLFFSSFSSLVGRFLYLGPKLSPVAYQSIFYYKAAGAIAP